MQFLNNASVRTKVMLAPAIAIAGLLALAGFGLVSGAAQTDRLELVVRERIPATLFAGEIHVRAYRLIASVNQSLVWEGGGFKAENIAALDKRILKEFEDVSGLLEKESKAAAEGSSERKALETARAELARFRSSAKDALEMKSGGLGDAASMIGVADEAAVRLNTALEALRTEQGRLTNAELDADKAVSQRNSVTLAVIALAALLASAAAALYCSRLLRRPIAQAVKAARSIAEGDLSVSLHADSRDEIGELVTAMQSMQESLRTLVAGVRERVDTITMVAREVALGNANLSSRTEQQASNLQETASSMDQMNNVVRSSAQTAQQANALAGGAANVAEKGGHIVGKVVQTMDEIAGSSSKIAEIVGVIDTIAFQTNILALNAAVEAARAGDQGRGFAVVAGEVRGLAQRSAQSAREIKTLIGNSVEKVQTGSRLVADAGSTMTDIVTQVRRVSELIGQINSSTLEQNNGIGQVNQSVAQLDQMTQQNAALVEQSAAAAESLREQADQLAEAVAVFRLGTGEVG